MTNTKRLLLVAGVLAAGLFLWHVRSPRLNTWPMRNHPPGPGPVLCFGDSLVAGVGADTAADFFPRRLDERLNRRVAALGTPGMTTEEAVKRVRKDRRIVAPVVVVTLGGNDILQRVPLDETVENLRQLFAEFQRRGALVAYTGVDGPVGSRTKRYRKLCRAHGVILVPSILKGIRDEPSLRSDQIHPNAKGYGVMAARAAEVLRPYLE